MRIDESGGSVGTMMSWCLTLLLIMLIPTAPASRGQATSKPDCGHSTVADAWGLAFASRAESFLAELQQTTRTDDKAKFATLVQYPIHVSWGKKSLDIYTASEFVRKYPSIMTPSLRRAILGQDPKCLFANGQGVMIGHGQLWFQQQKGGVMKIITITLDSADSGRYSPK